MCGFHWYWGIVWVEDSVGFKEFQEVVSVWTKGDY